MEEVIVVESVVVKVLEWWVVVIINIVVLVVGVRVNGDCSSVSIILCRRSVWRGCRLTRWVAQCLAF